MSKQYGFLIDSERCVDCRACVTACKSSNRIETNVAWRSVRTVWSGSYPKTSFRATSMSCNHCAEPACAAACPAGAISKRAEDGIVVVDKLKCVGCQTCGEVCPYHAPQYGKDGVMQKCELCLDRVSAGKKPSCVSTCQAGALSFGTMEELPKQAGKKIVRQLEGATQPSVFVPVTVD